MKKLILALALIGGCFAGDCFVYAETPVVCSPDNPCVFTGKAYKKTGSGSNSVDIKVYLKEVGGRYVYVVEVDNGAATLYAVDDEDVHNKYHFTYKGSVYEFSL